MPDTLPYATHLSNTIVIVTNKVLPVTSISLGLCPKYILLNVILVETGFYRALSTLTPASLLLVLLTVPVQGSHCHRQDLPSIVQAHSQVALLLVHLTVPVQGSHCHRQDLLSIVQAHKQVALLLSVLSLGQTTDYTGVYPECTPRLRPPSRSTILPSR